MPNANPLDALLDYARQHHVRAEHFASGLCLDASLDLARQARSLGLSDQVKFVRWRVEGDARFRDHWALTFGDGLVLDMTAVQIDGNAEPLRSLDSYTCALTSMRTYPLSVLLELMDRGGHSQSAIRSYPRMLVWRIQRTLVGYDAKQSLRRGSVSGLIKAVGEWFNAALVLASGHLHDRLVRRLACLQQVESEAVKMSPAATDLESIALAHGPTSSDSAVGGLA